MPDEHISVDVIRAPPKQEVTESPRLMRAANQATAPSDSVNENVGEEKSMTENLARDIEKEDKFSMNSGEDIDFKDVIEIEKEEELITEIIRDEIIEVITVEDTTDLNREAASPEFLGTVMKDNESEPHN